MMNLKVNCLLYKNQVGHEMVEENDRNKVLIVPVVVQDM